jgi:biotin-[acetyl-CoA-carboxylase] ligase BirA-like protein
MPMVEKCPWVYDAKVMWQCDHFESIGSTQSAAIDRLNRGPEGADPFVIWTRHQTEGRGRHGRRWLDSGDALAASFAWTTPEPLFEDHAWSIRVGLAGLRAISSLLPDSPFGLGIKWPNDLMVGDQKFGGILLNRLQRQGRCWLVAGIGINLSWPVGPAPELARPVTDLQALAGRPLSSGRVLEALKKELGQLQTDPLASLKDEFARHDVYHQLPVAVLHADTGQLICTGLNRGINHEGSLLIETESGLETLQMGELSLRAASQDLIT